MTRDPNRRLPMSSTSPLAVSGETVPDAWVEDLFGRLQAILGTALGNLYAGADVDLVKAEWGQALVGFSGDEIRRGLAAVRTRRFAPNLPDFLLLCRPSLDPEVAWSEAEQGFLAHRNGQRFEWSHPAVFWAGRDFAAELRVKQFADVRKRWEPALARWFAAGQYRPIPDPTAKRLQQHQQSMNPAFAEEARERIAAIRDRMVARLTGHVPAARRAEEEHDDEPSAEHQASLSERKLEQARAVAEYAAARGIRIPRRSAAAATSVAVGDPLAPILTHLTDPAEEDALFEEGLETLLAGLRP